MLLTTTLIILAVFSFIFLLIAILDIIRSNNFNDWCLRRNRGVELPLDEEVGKIKGFFRGLKRRIFRRSNIKYNKKLATSAYIMLIPATILAFIFIMLPILFSLGYAFTDYYLLKPDATKFVFLDNFKSLAEEIKVKGELYYAIKNTIKFVVFVVPLQIGLALGLALFCNRKVFGSNIFKVCFFAPVVISLTVTSYLWLQILSPSETGLLNSFLGLFGKEPQDFLRDKDKAILWIVLLSAWQGCGFQMLIFLSALTNIRQDLYEAASLDGANAFDKFLYITVPSLKPTFLYVVITVFIGACRIMVQPMLMINYQNHGITISYYMYQQGYYYRWVGLSSAVALVMTIVIGTITVIQRRILSDDDEKELKQSKIGSCVKTNLKKGFSFVGSNILKGLKFVAIYIVKALVVIKNAFNKVFGNVITKIKPTLCKVLRKIKAIWIKIRPVVYKVTYYTVGIVLSVLFLFPLVYMLATSTKTEAQFAASAGTLRMFLPNLNFKQMFSNYSTLFTQHEVWKYVINSSCYALVTIVLNILINGLAGYAIAKFTFPGKKFFNFIIIFLIVVPVETSIIPLYAIVKSLLGIKGKLSVLAVILPASISIFNIFLFVQFFKGIPTEFEEAARIDGASNLRVFFSVIVPLSKPIIATVAVFCFIGVWNDYLWPTMVLPSAGEGVWPLLPIQAALTSIQAIPNITTGEIMASLVITSIPVFIVYVCAQKYIVQGFGSAGLKL